MEPMTTSPPLTSRLPDTLLRHLTRVTGDDKHDPAARSTLDVLWVLHEHVLQLAPWESRDRFLLSKGHGPASYYAVLATQGLIPESWLDDLAGFGSPLGHHPDRLLIPPVEISSGSLGHGLPIAVGLARGLEVARATGRVFVLLGDAELDEGSNHEAIAVAGRWSLANLHAIVVDNDSASLGWPGGIGARFTGEGWTSTDVAGSDHDAIRRSLSGAGDRPHVTVVRTERKGS